MPSHTEHDRTQTLHAVRAYFKKKARIELARTRYQCKRLFPPVRPPKHITLEMMTAAHVYSCGFSTCMTCNRILEKGGSLADEVLEQRLYRDALGEESGEEGVLTWS